MITVNVGKQLTLQETGWNFPFKNVVSGLKKFSIFHGSACLQAFGLLGEIITLK